MKKINSSKTIQHRFYLVERDLRNLVDVISSIRGNIINGNVQPEYEDIVSACERFLEKSKVLVNKK